MKSLMNTLLGKSSDPVESTTIDYWTIQSLWEFLNTYTQVYQQSEIFISEDSFMKLKTDLSALRASWSHTINDKSLIIYTFDGRIEHKKIIKSRKSLNRLQIIVRKLK